MNETDKHLKHLKHLPGHLSVPTLHTFPHHLTLVMQVDGKCFWFYKTTVIGFGLLGRGSTFCEASTRGMTSALVVAGSRRPEDRLGVEEFAAKLVEFSAA